MSLESKSILSFDSRLQTPASRLFSSLVARHLPLVFAFLLLPFAFASATELLEIGSATKLRTPAIAPEEIKIVSYNIRWRGGDDLRRLIELLRTDKEIGNASIIGLQEVDRNKKRTGQVNTARLLADELGMHYAWAAPPPPKDKRKEQPEEETGVEILSLYPLTDVQRLVLPNEGPNGRHRAAIGATVLIGATRVRVYSVHSETRIPVARKMEQLRAVIDDLSRYEKTGANHTQIDRAIILGDFNTWEDEAVTGTSKLFNAARFTTPFPDGQATWRTFIIELKLDWIWLRNLRATDFGIDRKVGLSDHWPLWVTVRLKD